MWESSFLVLLKLSYRSSLNLFNVIGARACVDLNVDVGVRVGFRSGLLAWVRVGVGVDVGTVGRLGKWNLPDELILFKGGKNQRVGPSVDKFRSVRFGSKRSDTLAGLDSHFIFNFIFGSW